MGACVRLFAGLVLMLSVAWLLIDTRWQHMDKTILDGALHVEYDIGILRARVKIGSNVLGLSSHDDTYWIDDWKYKLCLAGSDSTDDDKDNMKDLVHASKWAAASLCVSLLMGLIWTSRSCAPKTRRGCCFRLFSFLGVISTSLAPLAYYHLRPNKLISEVGKSDNPSLSICFFVAVGLAPWSLIVWACVEWTKPKRKGGKNGNDEEKELLVATVPASEFTYGRQGEYRL
eukprot:TRINITY_DN826_c0_g1_i1.p1 TRINITY_DN826_c0_g1~~TRINITY_DN826_c0_g1_i1.p1  ORF type:complete len:263 (+),score=55.36 TRINITY_DN826_c0_g1_i1:100-789(+)